MSASAALVPGIYQAAREPWRWPRVVEDLADRFDASVAVYAVMAARLGVPDLRRVACAGMPPRLLSEWGERNPWLRPALEQRVGAVVRIDRLLAPEEVPEDFRAHIIEPFGMQFGLGATLVNSGGTFAAYSIYRKTPFGEQDARAFGRLFEPFAQATHFEEHLSGSIDWVYRAAGATVLLAGDGTVCFANAAAERLLAASPSLRIEHGFLRATTPDDQRTLDGLLRCACQRAGCRCSAVLGEAGVLGLSAMTIHGQLRPAGAPHAAMVALFLSDPETRAREAVHFLKDSYLLTTAETHVLEAMLRGTGLPAVSATLGIAPTTAKTHLQHIFQKTGTRHQAELVRLAFGATP